MPDSAGARVAGAVTRRFGDLDGKSLHSRLICRLAEIFRCAPLHPSTQRATGMLMNRGSGPLGSGCCAYAGPPANLVPVILPTSMFCSIHAVAPSGCL